MPRHVRTCFVCSATEEAQTIYGGRGIIGDQEMPALQAEPLNVGN